MGGPPKIDTQILPPYYGIVMSQKVSSKKTVKSKKYLLADEQDDEVVSKSAIGDFKSFSIILGYARPYRGQFIFGLLCMLLASLCAIGTAKLTGKLVDEGLLAKNKELTYLWASFIIVFELASLLTMWGGRKVLAKYSSLTVYDIRKALFEHLQRLPLSFYDRQPQGRVVTRVTHDVEEMENFFTQSMGRLLNALFMASLAMGAMIITDAKLGGVLVLSMLPAVLFIYLTRNWVRTINRNMSRSNSALNVRLSEFLNGLEVIRTYGLESWSQKEFQNNVDDYRTSHLKANRLYSWSRPLVSFLCSLPLIGLVWFGGHRVFEGAMAVGLFVTFIRYCERFFTPIMTLAREVHVIQQAFTSAERVASFLSHATEDAVLGEDGALCPREVNLKGGLEFKNVWMQYQTPEEEGQEWVLKNLSFVVQPGEKVGLAGTTGCGKTTTVNLLSRLYEYQKGDIYLDHHSIRYYRRNFLREKIGFVSQEAVIFRGTLRENLCAGQEVPDDKILYSCEVTGLARIMGENQLNLSSEILEAGSNLSVGERQVVALTRVLVKNPSVLVLDEATSNIDPWLEKIVHQAVDRVMEGRTCLIIAHRLATLLHCDRILVFEKGRLVEQGNQEELFHRKGYFYNLHQAQGPQGIL